MKWLEWFRLSSGDTGRSQSTELLGFLSDQLEIPVNDIRNYEQALRHSTAAHAKSDSNERLEFIGDAILDAVVAAYAFTKFPKGDEGFLSKLKSAVVSRHSLNKMARDLQLEQWIQAKVLNRQAMHVIGGNALEALIGAMYLDLGFDFTRNWIEKHLLRKLNSQRLLESLKDPKSELYEASHRDEATLEFEVTSQSDDPGASFSAKVLWNGKIVSSASSSSKKEAEQKAARKALAFLFPS